MNALYEFHKNFTDNSIDYCDMSVWWEVDASGKLDITVRSISDTDKQKRAVVWVRQGDIGHVPYKVTFHWTGVPQSLIPTSKLNDWFVRQLLVVDIVTTTILNAASPDDVEDITDLFGHKGWFTNLFPILIGATGVGVVRDKFNLTWNIEEDGTVRSKVIWAGKPEEETLKIPPEEMIWETKCVAQSNGYGGHIVHYVTTYPVTHVGRTLSDYWDDIFTCILSSIWDYRCQFLP